MSPHRQTSNEAGFTLLELLVSMAIVVLITTYLFNSFGFGRRAWQASASVESVASVDIARDYIRRRLAQAANVIQEERLPSEIVAFEGRSDSLTFVADVADQLRTGGLYAVTISLKAGSFVEEDGSTLLVAERLYRTAAQQSPPDRHVSELIDGVSGLRFQYFGDPAIEPAGDRWHDQWIDASRLPRLVAIGLEFDDRLGGRRVWPELLVALQMASHADRRLGQ